MNIFDYLDNNGVYFLDKARGKRSVVNLLLDHLIEKNKIKAADKKTLSKIIVQREEMGSTAIGGHVAFPHARSDLVSDIVICVCVCPSGIDFDSLDQEPVNVIALLLSNQKEAGLHLKMLAFLARLMRDKYLIQKLKCAHSPEEVLELLRKQQLAVQ